ELEREEVIDLLDAVLDHGLGVRRHRHLAFEHLFDEFGDETHAPLTGGLIAADAAFFDDLIEEIELDFLGGSRFRGGITLSHWIHPSSGVRFPSWPGPACRSC